MNPVEYAAHAPDERAARFRRDANKALPEDHVNLNALLYAASCESCTFREDDQCRAWPPRPRIVGGAAVAAWPKIKLTDWCGCWRSL